MTDQAVEPIAEQEEMADEPFAVTVHLVGPTWGVETGRKFTSATVLRRRRAKDKVLREWKEHGTVEGVRSMDLRLALRAQKIAFRGNAGHAELTALVERSFPWAERAQEMDVCVCDQCRTDWVSDDIRTFVAAACGLPKRRLKGMYADNNVIAKESQSLDELGVVAGGEVQLVVAPDNERRQRPASAASRLHSKAGEEKKEHIAAVRDTFQRPLQPGRTCADRAFAGGRCGACSTRAWPASSARSGSSLQTPTPARSSSSATATLR